MKQTPIIPVKDPVLRYNFTSLSNALRHIPIIWGDGDPEGVIEAPPGFLYLRIDGGAGTTLYVKETGTGKTGWVGK
jgi:hypothetical protein